MRIIGEGAEAKIYRIELLDRRLVLKMRGRKKYRVKELDESLRKERTKREARIMQRLGTLGIKAPRIAAAGRYSIFMEELSGTLLKDSSISKGISAEAGRILAKMHQNNIVHGDFTPANLMLCKKSLYVIDFGLSEITNSVEEEATDLLLMKRSLPANVYSAFQKSYAASNPDSRTVIRQLSEIEKRGRYQIRTLA